MNSKNIISFFFLSLYLTTIFSSIIPYLEYAINYDYISKVLCINKEVKNSSCHGKCHLKKQIQKTVEAKIPSEERNSRIITLNDYDPFVFNKYQLEIISPIKVCKNLTEFDYLLLNGFSKTLFRPPLLIS